MAGFFKVLNHDEAVRVDSAASPVLYIGKAKINSATSSPVWKIAQLNTTGGATIAYADSGNYTQIWDNRTSLTYS